MSANSPTSADAGTMALERSGTHLAQSAGPRTTPRPTSSRPHELEAAGPASRDLPAAPTGRNAARLARGRGSSISNHDDDAGERLFTVDEAASLVNLSPADLVKRLGKAPEVRLGRFALQLRTSSVVAVRRLGLD